MIDHLPEIAVLFIGAGAGGVMAGIFLSCRTTKAERQWQERERETVVKNLPDFEVYSAARQRNANLRTNRR